MATDEYLTHTSLHNLSSKSAIEECKSSSIPDSGGFDCNICLDSVQDPVVTTCGHLYCWPCIYKWIHQEHNICPVCKSQVSENNLIPLYGRGQSDEKSDDFEPIIPDRPRGPPYVVSATSATTTTTSQYPSQHEYGYTSVPDVRSATFHPMIGMFGEMISTRFFGGSQPFYTYPNSYGVVVTRNARVRRNVRQVDRSLSRLSIFLYCCLVFCLLFF